jgi:hypothetical protein
MMKKLIVKPCKGWRLEKYDHKIQVKLYPQLILLHPHKTMSKIKRMNKMKIKLMMKRKALIKEEIRTMRIMKDQEQRHHT